MEKEIIMHKRFDREVWVFKDSFTGSLAKWLVKQSPYVVPDNLSKCLESFHSKLDFLCVWDSADMAQVHLKGLTHDLNMILESIPEICALNEPKNFTDKDFFFLDRYSAEPNPDDNFIDIMAVAQNMTCDLAEREDAQAWLDTHSELISIPEIKETI